ncbi:MAG: hypothetical protein ACM3H8_06680 [Sphingobacteriales bacterium]
MKPLTRPFSKINYILLITVCIIIFSCNSYYKASVANKKPETIDSLQLNNRYFVLRSGESSFYMKGVKLSSDKQTLQCILDSLPPEHQLHLSKGIRGNMRYKNTPAQLPVLNEVHLYIAQDNLIKAGDYTLTLDKVQKIEVLEKDRKRTTNSYVIGALGYTLGAFAVVGIIIAATKSSCPFVSAYNGTDFNVQGEIYGGAIYPQLVRHDYLSLKMAPAANGDLQIKISNELKEKQYTDIAELLVITHAKGTKVLSDESGNLYTVSKPQTAFSATLGNKDVRSALNEAGDNKLLYFDDSSTTNAGNELILGFNKSLQQNKARLILSLKNSYWLDFLYGDMIKGFGSYYPTFIKQQKKKPIDALKKWSRDQQIPLEISVETASGWKKITELTTIGPVTTREVVVQVDLSGTEGNITKIKLSSGFMFWEIDYAAIDYSNENNFTVQKINPYKATDETGKDVLSAFEKEDGVFLEQPLPGTVATLNYKWNKPADDKQTQSFILHTKGYYEHVREFTGKPNVKFLKQFTQPNAFAVYGKGMYRKLKNANLQSMAKN